jgi:hypothetical protein
VLGFQEIARSQFAEQQIENQTENSNRQMRNEITNKKCNQGRDKGRIMNNKDHEECTRKVQERRRKLRQLGENQRENLRKFVSSDTILHKVNGKKYLSLI